MLQQLWNVAGSLSVVEAITTCTVDGAPHVRRRPLAGARVQIVGWPDEHACTSVWGEARTDHRGHFRAAARRPAWAQLVHLRVRLADAALVVRAGADAGADAHARAADADWLPVRTISADGPTLGVGHQAFDLRAAPPLGAPAAVRTAVAWYVARSTLDWLAAASGLPSAPGDGPLVVVADARLDAAAPADALRTLVRRATRAWLARHPAAVRRWRHATRAAPPSRAAIDTVTPLLVERVAGTVIAALWPSPVRYAGEIDAPHRARAVGE